MIGDGAIVKDAKAMEAKITAAYQTFKATFPTAEAANLYLTQYLAKYPFDGKTTSEALLSKSISEVAEMFKKAVRPSSASLHTADAA